MKEQFSDHPILMKPSRIKSDEERKPPCLHADRRENIHPIKREFLNGFEDEIRKENGNRL